MAKISKTKGSAFERLVAKKILDAAGPEYTASDCRRVPMSGADKYFDQGDLIVSPRLREIFPFCVECKHRKNFRLEQVFSLVADFVSYHQQVLDACSHENNCRYPMVVIRGNGGHIFGAIPFETWHDIKHPLSETALVYQCAERVWIMLELDVLLQAVINDRKVLKAPNADVIKDVRTTMAAKTA